MTPLLELRNVTKAFGGGFLKRSIQTVAVDDISFTIQSGKPVHNGDCGGERKRQDHHGQAAPGRFGTDVRASVLQG